MHKDPIMDLIDSQIRKYTFMFLATPVVGVAILLALQWVADHFG